MFRLSRRINRPTYIAGLVLIPLLIVVIQVILGTLISFVPGIEESLNKAETDGLVTVTGIVLMLIYFPFLLLMLTYLFLLLKQRANDVGDRSLLVALLAGITVIGIPILALIPGQKGHNKYGAAPKSGIHLT